MTWRLIHGDSADALKTLPDASVDSVVTDPPAGIGFMGKEWDKDKGGREQWIAWLSSIMRECLRILKPGGHALVWALPRMSHWTATAIEDAGFEVRDVVMHLFGTGFPKSLNVGKAIAKKHAEQRHLAEEWEGWGTALKPAAEHWILCRRPFDESVAENVLAHGTGGLNIDGCRIGGIDTRRTAGGAPSDSGWGFKKGAVAGPALGRWPAHVTFDEEAAAMLDEQSGELPAGVSVRRNKGIAAGNTSFLDRADPTPRPDMGYGDSGGASRFFYVAKASTAEKTSRGQVENRHPTVKPIALMRWLCRLVTPPGGTVLDPFAGSGTTLIAATHEGFLSIGIEQDEESIKTAEGRLAALAQEAA